MNMYALYEGGALTEAEVENSFGGNICRCTGYRPILEAFKTLAKCGDIEDYVACGRRAECGRCEEMEGFSMELRDSQFVKVFYLKDLLQVVRSSAGKTYMLVGGNTAQGKNDNLYFFDYFSRVFRGL